MELIAVVFPAAIMYNHNKMTNVSVKVVYQWLEPRPQKMTRQLCIKGRNMTVWHLVYHIVIGSRSPEEVAQDLDLPLEAVQEALSYYHENKDMIDAETEQTARDLGLR